MNRILIALTILFLIIATSTFSQTHKRIGVIGSSTSYGYFGNPSLYPRDSGWTFKIQKYYKDKGMLDTLYNLAVVSADCYNGMPSSYIPPAGRNLPDPVHNITAILNQVPKPDVVIVNYPTNNYDWLPNSEILQCLQTIKDSANAQNVRCYITTTQPRNNFSPQERQKLADLQLLILIQFGQWAIDFWTDVVSNDNSNLINPIYSLGDGVHLNPAGQTELEQRVINASIFGTVILPVHLTEFNAHKNGNTVLLHWSCDDKASVFFTIEKGTDGTHFNPIGNIQKSKNTSYSFTDNIPLLGANYYRVCITGSNSEKEYSTIERIDFKKSGLVVSSIDPTVSNQHIFFTIQTDTRKPVTIYITNTEGKRVSTDEVIVNNNFAFIKDISALQAGLYFVNISTQNEQQQRKFVKQ